MEVDDLIRARDEAASVSYQSFVLLIGSRHNDLFCFVENKDAPYYHLRIKSVFIGNVHYIRCGNKKLVQKTFELVKYHKEFDKYKKAFFVDRDFDKSIKNKFDEIYETPCYSIENLYCYSSSLKELIKTDFHIGEEDPLYEKIINLYESLQEDFLKASLLFNAWYKLQKIKRSELKTKLEIKLDDNLISEFIEMDMQKITSKYNEDTIKQKYPNHLPYNAEELTEVIDKLQKEDLILNLRGKFIFNFMTSFIRKLIEDGADTKKRKVLTKKIKYNMDNSSALTLLTTYAQTPNCLIEFLKKYN